MKQQQMGSIDRSWDGVIIAATIGILQFIYHGGGGGQGGGLKLVESHFHLLKEISLYASISLISLTNCKPLPCSTAHKNALFFIILAYASLLSAAAPTKLWWLPYLSCIRPLYELLRDFYLFSTNKPFHHFWEFWGQVQNAAARCKQSAQKIIHHFVPNYVGPSSSAPANSNSDEVN
ncbi:hypothetical protein MRB53_008316 [Persea americana]|uniref:Uncharacterized protein n=1 Tax=Persea americana TaxID=3435 RepID=A0ACC2MLS5_PERAE|nr:hypothetical protein MRB53_008316 [Persea americana]